MNLYGMRLGELEQMVAVWGEAPYRARQISDWLYHHHEASADRMLNLPASLRARLATDFTIHSPAPESGVSGADGTSRHAWRGSTGEIYESALIPEGRRLTLCLSTQAGCRVGCSFCLTGRRGLRQHLVSSEILAQYRNLDERDRITHLVFMGMGEPLDNTDEVLRTLDVLTAPWGYGVSPRRITVSTVGMLPDLERLLDETDVNVAISLHAASRADRMALVPSERRHPIAATTELLRDRVRAGRQPFTGTGRRRVSFEITMLDGLTDRAEQAAAVLDLMRGIPARVNLIPWNPFPGATLHASPREAIERFQAVIKGAGVVATIRESRGADIGAACGLLAGRRDAVTETVIPPRRGCDPPPSHGREPGPRSP